MPRLTRFFLAATLALLPLGIAYGGDDTAFVATGDGAFGTIDLNTGAVNPIGNTGSNLAGLGELNGNLYATFLGDNILYSIDPATSNMTAIGGTAGLTFEAFGSTNEALYGVSDSGGNELYSLNPNTGVATDIGAFDTTLGDWFNLSTGSPTLYFASDTSLYSVNTSTGHATFLGDTGGADVGALVFENGTLYGGANGTFNPCGDCCVGDCCINCAAELHAIDPTLPTVVSLDPTLVANNATAIANANVSAPFFALAPDVIAATPEPASIGLILAAMLMLGLVWRRRQRFYNL